MINWKVIFKMSGLLLGVEILLLIASLVSALIYHEDVMPFVWCILVCAVVGGGGLIYGRGSGQNVGRKDSYLIVSAIWVLFSILGMIPYLVANTFNDVAGAFFETMSGFTSTGATALPNIDEQPRSILFWRSLTQWIGGIGIIFFTVAFLPAVGQSDVKIFAAESTGPIHNKIQPRISVTARWIASIYIMLTLSCTLLLYLLGMTFFDAVNFSLTTTATGGFAPHTAMLHELYDSPAIEYVITFFMFASGTNFTLLYWAFFKRQFSKIFRDHEFRCYMAICFGAIIIVTTIMYLHPHTPFNLELSFREAAFTVVSLQTTTGFASCDYMLWPSMAHPVLLIVMLAGSCSGSTTGGMKCIRLSMINRILRNECIHILHPRAVLPLKINGTVIPQSVRQTLLAFLSLFGVFCVTGTLALSFCGLTLEEAMSIAISTLSNVGPALGRFGPSQCWDILSPMAKYVCSFLMLIGRLEIFPIVIIFTRGFWAKN